MVGVCFKELYLGRSNTLNLYFSSINATNALFGTKFTLGLRKGALKAFQRFVRTAELEKRTFQGRIESSFIEWDGYKNPWMERLRQGIGPEEKKHLNVLRRQRLKNLDADEEHPQEVKDEMKRLMQLEGELSKEYLEKRLQEDEEESEDTGDVDGIADKSSNYSEKAINATDSMGDATISDSTLEHSSRPVVTFILRTQIR